MNGILARRMEYELATSVQGLNFLRGLTGVYMSDEIDDTTMDLVIWTPEGAKSGQAKILAGLASRLTTAVIQAVASGSTSVSQLEGSVAKVFAGHIDLLNVGGDEVSRVGITRGITENVITILKGAMILETKKIQLEDGGFRTVLGVTAPYSKTIESLAIGCIIPILPLICRPGVWGDKVTGGYLESSYRKVAGVDTMTIFNPHLASQPIISGVQHEVVNKLSGVAHRINTPLLLFALQEWANPDSIFFNGYNSPKVGDESHTSKFELNLMILLTAILFMNTPFFLPHRIDFRGRVYPTPQFSYQLGDLGRALFATSPYEVDSNDLATLELAGVNYFGGKASKVIGGGGVVGVTDYSLASEPFQFKAIQMAIEGVQASLERNEVATTDLIVWADASANGIQHIAMLTGDKEMAGMVNISGGERRDIYTLVAGVIIKILTEKGGRLPFVVDRDIIKALVMLTPYNISAIGFADKVLEKVTGVKFMELKRGTSKSKTIRLTMTNLESFKVSQKDLNVFWTEKLEIKDSKVVGGILTTNRHAVKTTALEIFRIFGVILPRLGEFKSVLSGFAGGSLYDESREGGVGFYLPGRLR